MLQQWDCEFPGRTETIFSALTRVSPSQLADTRLFNFNDLQLDRSQSQDLTNVEPLSEKLIPQNGLRASEKPFTEINGNGIPRQVEHLIDSVNLS